MKLHNFYRKFEDTPKEKRFMLIGLKPEPTSLFVIFKRLARAREQKKYFEEQEEHLLLQAEEAFKQING
jgi:hypothetical protein